MARFEQKHARGERRRLHVRHRVAGTSERPRLTVAKSLRHITAQLIDDSNGNTVAYWSTVNAKEAAKGTKTEVAKEVGKKIAELAKAKGVTKAVFDRNRFRYHGRIKAVAEGAREAGLTI
jgi:large subunit ribosomal protein L18